MVEEASLIYGFPELKGDVLRYADSCYILELANEMTRDGGHQNPELFEVLLCFLKLVNFSGGDKSLSEVLRDKTPHYAQVTCLIFQGASFAGKIFQGAGCFSIPKRAERFAGFALGTHGVPMRSMGRHGSDSAV